MVFAKWESGYIKRYKPSIEYLELLGVVAALLTWGHLLKNCRVVIFCDNAAIVGMLNNMVSSCCNCMYPLRLLSLNNLIFNRRAFARHITSEDNFLSDALSRLQFDCFWRLTPDGMDWELSKILPLVWPASHIWQKI